MKVPPNDGTRFQIRVGSSKPSGYWDADGRTLTWYDRGLWHWRFKVSSKDSARDQLREHYTRAKGQKGHDGQDGA